MQPTSLFFIHIYTPNKTDSKPIMEGYSITKGKRNSTFSITRNLEKTMKELFHREVKMKLFFAQ